MKRDTGEVQMNSSLRDQLLKAGLVDEKRARQAEVESKQKNREASKARKSGLQPEPSAAQAAAERARQERELHARRSRELNEAREAERARKAARAELKRLIDATALPHGKGDIRYHFLRGKKIKRLYVDQNQRSELAAGRLAIVDWEGSYSLIPLETAEKVLERLPETFVFIAEPEAAQIDPEDPYAAFPIPDDLVW
jgi:uncharacterized protein